MIIRVRDKYFNRKEYYFEALLLKRELEHEFKEIMLRYGFKMRGSDYVNDKYMKVRMIVFIPSGKSL